MRCKLGSFVVRRVPRRGGVGTRRFLRLTMKDGGYVKRKKTGHCPAGYMHRRIGRDGRESCKRGGFVAKQNFQRRDENESCKARGGVLIFYRTKSKIF